MKTKTYSIPGASFATYPEAVRALKDFCTRLGCGANIKTDAGIIATGTIDERGHFVLEEV
jgi:hypothetical protein